MLFSGTLNRPLKDRVEFAIQTFTICNLKIMAMEEFIISIGEQEDYRITFFQMIRGEGWQAGYNLIAFEKNWPYVKYASDGKSKIHFITTESHPIYWDCSIFHGYIENQKVYTSD